MAGRLLSLRPVLKEPHIVEVGTNNRIVASELSNMRPQLEMYLRQQLQNRGLVLNIVVEEVQTAHKILSRVEQYQTLEQRNPAIRKLKELLDLDLS